MKSPCFMRLTSNQYDGYGMDMWYAPDDLRPFARCSTFTKLHGLLLFRHYCDEYLAALAKGVWPGGAFLTAEYPLAWELMGASNETMTTRCGSWHEE